MKIVDILNDLVSDCKVSRAEARIKSEVVAELEKLKIPENMYHIDPTLKEVKLRNAGVEACIQKVRGL